MLNTCSRMLSYHQDIQTDRENHQDTWQTLECHVKSSHAHWMHWNAVIFELVRMCCPLKNSCFKQFNSCIIDKQYKQTHWQMYAAENMPTLSLCGWWRWWLMNGRLCAVIMFHTYTLHLLRLSFEYVWQSVLHDVDAACGCFFYEAV